MGDFKPFSAYIVDACRTAGGKKNGKLSGWHPADLGATVCDGLVERTKIDPSLVEDVIIGCVCQSGAQAGNIGRNVVLASRLLPESVPGTAVDRQCGSSQQAIHQGATAVMSGVHDCVIVGGVESMSLVPIGANIIDSFQAGHGQPMSPDMFAKYKDSLQQFTDLGLSPSTFSQFGGAELLSKKYGLTKEDLDKFAVASHKRAHEATQAGKFKDEIIPIPARQMEKKDMLPAEKKDDAPAAPELHMHDEGIRPSANLEGVSKMKPMFKNGIITPATSSQICDGAAALLICNENGLKRLGVKPRAKITMLSLAAADPVIMLEGPVPASKACLQKAGLKIEDMDLYEVNEAFAPVPLAWCKALGGDFEKLNVNGGAMALGHPLGGTGAKLMTTLLHELERRRGRYGLLSICEGGGTANATIIERMDMPSSKL
jgi:acetyl-CoA acetyltransferase family protein